jgi:Tol biopolymer transport system component
MIGLPRIGEINSSRRVLGLVLLVSLAVAIVTVVGFSKWRQTSQSLDSDQQQRQSLDPPMALTTLSRTIKKICFERYDLKEAKKVHGGWIYLKDLVSNKEIKLIEGSQADLSPSGEEIAFNGGAPYDFPTKLADLTASQGARVQIVNVRTHEVLAPEGIAGLRTSHPMWSADGTKLAFILTSENRADVGVLDISSGKWRAISRNLDYGSASEPIYLDSWVAGDRSVLFHTTETVYRVALDGTLLQKIPALSFGISDSESRFLMSSDGRHLIFNRSEVTLLGEEGYVIYRYDFVDNKLSRITPLSVSGDAPRWLPSEKEILFTCVTPERDTSDICKIGIDGTGLTTLLRYGAFASYSTR